MAVKKWRGKWVVDFVIDGRRIRRVSPVQTKRGAQAYETELRIELAQAPAPSDAGQPTTFAEFVPEWMTTYVAIHNKPSEQQRKALILRNHLGPFFGKLRLDQITTRHIEGYKAHALGKGLKSSTVNIQLGVLSKVLNSAHDWGIIAKVPKITTFRRESTPFDWLRPSEAERMLTAMRDQEFRWFVFVFIAIRTGLRRGEIIALHWSEIDFEQRRITVKWSLWHGKLDTPKSRRSRVVPMASDLVEVMRRWRAQNPSELLFPNPDGKLYYDADGANRAFNKALHAAGLRQMRVHDLRHTFASHLVLMGRSLKEIQVLLGHHSVTMTERYAHVGDDQLVAAVECLDGLGTAKPGGDEGA